MKIWIALILAALVAGASAQSCSCETMKWAICDGNPCTCTILVGHNMKQPLDCSKLIPKCFLMKAEMYSASKGLDIRTIGEKPVETAFLDNDGIYDPECESDGKFKAKQCNNMEECWCVNSAGVRRTNKGDKNFVCEKLVETYWIRLQLTHKPVEGEVNAANLKIAIANTIHKRYDNFDKDMVEEVQYDPDARLIVVDVKKPMGDRKNDLTQMAYYMEKDVKVLPLFKNQEKFEPVVGGKKLEMERILVYYVDEEAPTFTSCSCETMKWATCDGTPCTCTILVGCSMKQPLDCSKLIPKCFLMKAEMYRASKGLDTRTIGGKPVETAFLDNEGIYDPDCESDGKFKAKQCNNTEECWCVNSAGVRRTDKGDKTLVCEKLVETYWVRLQLTHKPVDGEVNAANLKTDIADAINKRYDNFNKDLVEEVQYDPDARLIVVDVKKQKGDRKNDLTQMAYYMEKDVKVLPLFKNQEKFEPVVGGKKLEIEKILVYYVDEEDPTFTTCSCETMKWATCDRAPCTCTILVGRNMNQPLDCSKLIPKCFLMKAEMYRASKGLDTRTIGGKPVETAFLDNDDIYDPDCESDGKFKAKQCNNTEECWCVNSAGVRRTDKGDKTLVCEKLVETYWVRLQLTHKPVDGEVNAANLKSDIADAINKRYDNFDKDLVEEVQYDPDARLIVVDVKKPKGDRKSDLTQMAYYMEKDVKVQPLFRNQDKFEPVVGGKKLEMEKILVYYVDEEPPTFTMKNLSGGIITLIVVVVVVVLAVVAGLLVRFCTKREEFLDDTSTTVLYSKKD